MEISEQLHTFSSSRTCAFTYPKRAILTLSYALLCLTQILAVPWLGLTEQLPVRFSKPNGYTSHPVTLPEALGVYSLPNHPYPRITVVRTPGEIDLNRPQTDIEKEVLFSYHQVGYTDAKILGSTITTVSSTEAQQVELSFAQDNQEISALATLMPVAGQTIVFTALFSKEFEEVARYDFQKFLEAVEVLKPQLVVATKEDSVNSSFLAAGILGRLLVFLLIALVIWLLRKMIRA